MHEPVWRVQLVVFEKITGAYLHQITREIMLLLIDNLHEKGITESQDRRNFDSARFDRCTSERPFIHGLGNTLYILYSVGIGVDGWIDGITFPSGLSKLTM